MSNNITEVRLLSVPLTNDYINTIYFGSASEQETYFKSKHIKTYTDFSYQRKDNYIRVPDMYDSVMSCNYVMYKNSQYNSKWFYAFITDIKYVDDGRTDIYIETDVLQTWLFNYNVLTSFVEREHVKDDTIGKHTIPEQVETGDYVINDYNHNNDGNLSSVILGCTVDLNSDDLASLDGRDYNGVYSGVRYYKLSPDINLGPAIKKLNEAGKIDAITCLYMAPSYYVETTDSEQLYKEVKPSDDAFEIGWVHKISDTISINSNNLKPTHLNGHTPRNKKLLTYPYCYMLMDNNAGGNAIYKYELFKNPNNENLCDFKIRSAVTPGMSIKLIPKYYNGLVDNYSESLNSGKYPICNWSNDIYTNWLTQNGVNIGINIGANLVQAGIGVAGALASGVTGGLSLIAGASALASGITGIAGTVGEVYQHSFQPPQAEGNVNAGDVAFGSKRLSFTAYTMSIKKEFAQIIDSYFDMFGYKVNQIKVPETNHREAWWYTKTIDVNITGKIPMNDLNKIKQCYNKGITFWRNGKTVGDYSVTNGIKE